VSIDDGPWVSGVRAGAVLTVGRHPRCGLQMADASTSHVSRLQCILVRARGRLVVYDMCSLNGTHACVVSHADEQRTRLPAEVLDALDGRPRWKVSRPEARLLLVFPWGPGSELRLAVRCDNAEARISLREPLERHAPRATEPPRGSAAVQFDVQFDSSTLAQRAQPAQLARLAQLGGTLCASSVGDDDAIVTALPEAAGPGAAPTAMPTNAIHRHAMHDAAPAAAPDAAAPDAAAPDAAEPTAAPAATPADVVTVADDAPDAKSGGGERSVGRFTVRAEPSDAAPLPASAAVPQAAPAPPDAAAADQACAGHERTCVVCYELVGAGAFARCSSSGAAHALCVPCFVAFAEAEVAQDEGLIRQRHGRLLCPMRAAELGGASVPHQRRTHARQRRATISCP
jgi:hypothetical protein